MAGDDVDGAPLTLDRLYAEHHAWALRVARGVVGDLHEAEDIVSEVFLGIHRAQQKGGGPTGNARGYLRRSIQNEATKLWARRRFEQVTDIVPETEEPDPAEALLRALERQKTLAAAPPAYAAVVYRMDILGHTADETAEELDMTVSAVKSVLHRARSALKAAS